MRMKITAFLTLVLAFSSVVVGTRKASAGKQQLSQQHISQLEQKEKSGWITLKERVQLAKARGKQKLIVPGVVTNYSIGMPASPDAADQVLSDHTVVVVRLAEKKSYIRDGVIGGTWNKFKITDTFSQAHPQPSHVVWSYIPEELLPVHDDEILVHTADGTLMIDEVEVTQNDLSLAAFRKGQKYLLVLSLDPSTRIGDMRLGLYSVLTINADNSLDARRDEDYLQRVIKAYHGGSLERLRSDLKSRSGSR